MTDDNNWVESADLSNDNVDKKPQLKKSEEKHQGLVKIPVTFQVPIQEKQD